MTALYDEFDSYPARWLRSLVAAGEVAPGTVDERSVRDVAPEDLRGAVQFHAFAGIGGWSRALRLAGWPDDVPAWTGSCPCQPFSQAGRLAGPDDERHLWPEWWRLIRECRPGVVLFEQVASPAGLAWLDLVLADLEGAGYAAWACDIPAAGAGAPHKRQRLYGAAVDPGQQRALGGRLADARARGRAQLGETRLHAGGQRRDDAAGRGAPDQLGDPGGERGRRHAGAVPGAQGSRAGERVRAGDLPHEPEPAGAARGAWDDPDWVWCRDARWRPVGPGVEPLVARVPTELGRDRPARLRGYGNSICAPLAAEFAGAVMDHLVDLA